MSKNQGEGMTFLPGMGWGGGGNSSDFFPWGGGNLLERLENGGRCHTKKKHATFLAKRVSYEIQFICTFRHLNNVYSMKKYIGSTGLQTERTTVITIPTATTIYQLQIRQQP